MDELVESDIQDLQSSPYNTPVEHRSHSRDSYVREIHETHYNELISLTPHTSYSLYSFPQHTDIPTSSTAVNMPTSSSVADTPADPASSIVSTLSETESGVSPENSTEVSDTQIYSIKCAVCEQKCSLAKCCPGYKQPVHLDCGQSVEGIENTVGPIWCISCWIHVGSKSLQKRRISAKRGQNKQIKRMENQTNKKFRTFYVGENILLLVLELDKRSPFDYET